MKFCVKEYLLDIQIKAYIKATLKNKRIALNHFADWCKADIEDIKPVDIKQFIQVQMEKGLQPTSNPFKNMDNINQFSICDVHSLVVPPTLIYI
jgi:site-specific recombinase XerD